MKRLAIASLGAMAMLAPAACGSGGGAGASPAAAGAARPYTVWANLGQASGPSLGVVSVPSGNRRDLPDAVLNPRLGVAYSVVPDAGNTAVRVLDAVTGEKRAEQSLPGTYVLPIPNSDQVPAGLSPHGSWLVLESPGPGPGAPTPAVSRLAVVSTAFKSAPRRFQLEGWFRFDAVDDSGQSVYLIEYLAGGQGSYQVRRYDLARGVLDATVIAEKGELNRPMRGRALQGLYSPDGGLHLGLYARSSGVGFIHVLPLTPQIQFAFCVDLPGRFSDAATQMAWTAAVTADGSRLYAANEVLGVAIAMTIPRAGQFDNPRIVRQATLPMPAAGPAGMALPGPRLALSPDAKSLYLATGEAILELDANTLAVRGRRLGASPVTTLVMGPDGSYLVAGHPDGHLDQFDLRTGARVSSVATPLTILGLAAVRSD